MKILPILLILYGCTIVYDESQQQQILNLSEVKSTYCKPSSVPYRYKKSEKIVYTKTDKEKIPEIAKEREKVAEPELPKELNENTLKNYIKELQKWGRKGWNS